ncbi:MAG: hypothetical protein CL908_20870, partial [Deltaproteobacteria bacterium]|nr:hypothetical protein [Deltaproteobacteria bacterium]
GLAPHYGNDTPFRLVWHYVAKNRTCTSTRTPQELQALRDSTIARIDEIQSTTTFAPKKIALCAWCEYKVRCPLWNPDTKDPATEPVAGATETSAAAPPEPPAGEPTEARSGTAPDGEATGIQLDLL